MENENKNYSMYNAEHIRDLLKKHIEEMTERKEKFSCRGRWYSYTYRPTIRIDDVYKELSIFDWWKHELSLQNVKDMYNFVNKAIKLGFKGYVCFKVGATGCARIAEEFCNSNFNNPNRDLYTCLTEYLEYYESRYDKTLTDNILDMELVDNYHIEHGGIAFAGETVRDFLEETNSPFNITVRELNDRLNLCGIKRIVL